MNYVLILGVVCTTVAVGALGYLLGRYQANLVDRIRTLESQDIVTSEPMKPIITGGAYQPPREFSNTVDTKRKAGLVETKTPQQLEWENNNELARLEHSA